MDIEKLWEILHKERNTASLQELPGNFREEVRQYFERLKEERGEADESRGVLLEDEIRNTRMKVEDIVRRRIGKIVKLASSGMSATPKGMLEEEEEIFEGVKSHVEAGKERIFASMLGEEQSESESESRGMGGKRSGKGKKSPSRHVLNSDESLPTSSEERNEELHIVRILEDIPAFMGTDGRVYRVKKEDVIMLPKTNAEILCKRGVATEFEGRRRGECSGR